MLIRQRAPEPYLQDLTAFLARLRLTLSAEKTRVVEAERGFDFLGVRLVRKPTRRDRAGSSVMAFLVPEP